jgi:hypothetical protein
MVRGTLGAAALVVVAGALGSAAVAATIGPVDQARQPPLACTVTPTHGAAVCPSLTRAVRTAATVPSRDAAPPACGGAQDAGVSCPPSGADAVVGTGPGERAGPGN